MTKYYALIEFIKTEYLDNAHVNIGEDIPDAVKKIKDEFDIKVCQYDGIQYRHRTLFLKDIDKRAINILIHRWETPEKAEPTF